MIIGKYICDFYCDMDKSHVLKDVVAPTRPLCIAKARVLGWSVYPHSGMSRCPECKGIQKDSIIGKRNVSEAVYMYKVLEMTYEQIGEKFGVSKQAIFDLLKRTGNGPKTVKGGEKNV